MKNKNDDPVPDLGLYLGHELNIDPEFLFDLQDIRIREIYRSDDDHFTAISREAINGQEWSVSLDFSPESHRSLLDRIEQQKGKTLLKDAGNTFQFNAPLRLKVEASLGQPSHTGEHDFIPFQVKEVICC